MTPYACDMTSIFETAYLPQRPLASDAKSGAYRRYGREQALTKHYIESNPKALKSLIVIDRDSTDTLHAVSVTDLPAPLYTVANVHTGTGHIVYGLKNPVCLTDAGSRRPVNLLARVEQGLNEHFGGDPAYLNGITKNPLFPPLGNLTTEYESRLYSLAELATPLADLGLLAPSNARKRLFLSSVGRNVSLFETVRQIAYRDIRDHFADIPNGGWDRRVFQIAWEINETEIANEFSAGGLSASEVKSLARSISRWTARKFTPQTFQARQKYLAEIATKKSAENRNKEKAVHEWLLQNQ